MSEDLEIHTYLTISPNEYGIYIFDQKNSKNLYKNTFKIEQINNSVDSNILNEFLEKNIFQIEKLIGKFIENIFLILEDKKIFNLEIGIKKKNYNISVTKEYLENSLVKAKDLFRESYHDQEIIHMIINKYFINGETYSLIEENLKTDHFGLEINFKSISRKTIYDLNKILENYQIKITKFLDGSYVKANFSKDIELAEMSYKILSGYNQNEVIFVPKNTKKLAFFEKFFQLFS